MSGDVQPRKRKEKRRKKEDEDTGTPPPTLVNPAELASDNVTLHIYKEGSTGGHWCARIIFFALFTVLIGLVGIIIFEHRGTTDVDTPIASSKWAVIFEGWVDDVFPFHDGEHEKHDSEISHEIDHEEEEHEEEEDDHENEEEEDESGGTDEDQEENVGDNESNRVEEEEEAEESNEDVDDEEDQTEADDYDDNDADEDEGISDQQNDMEDEEEEEQEDEDEGDEGIDSRAENDEGFAEDDDMGVLDEIDDHQNDENEGQNDNDDDEEDITNISAPDLDMSIEGIKPFEKMDEDDIYEYVSIPGVNDIDDSTEPLEEVEEGEPEEIINEVEIEPLKDEVKEEEDETSVAVKFGVGVALVIAAHFVLVRRWKNVDDSPEVIDLSRRNTMIPPPVPKQLNIKGDVAQKQQIKNLQELEPKYKNLPAEEIKIPHNKQSGAFQAFKNFAKKEDQGNIPLLSKKDEPEFYTSESERFSGTEQESEYDEEDLEDEEYLEEEEEEIEEDEVEEVDDHDLVAKLEAKYGKLPTPSQSEEEEEDVEDEEEYEEEEELEDEEEEEEEEKDIGDWKRLNAPQPMHSGGEKSKNKNTKEVSKTPQSSSRGGRQEFDFTEPVDNNDVNIQEEIEQWLAGDLDN